MRTHCKSAHPRASCNVGSIQEFKFFTESIGISRRQISEHPNPGQLYSTLMDLIVRFAHSGLIHGDFNEFNILIRRDTGEPVVIDFPQMVSTSHMNAEWYFNRDVECIRTFFRRRFRYESLVWPRFTSTIKEVEGLKRGDGEEGDGYRLDVVVSASGFSGKDQRVLEEVSVVHIKGDLICKHPNVADFFDAVLGVNEARW